MKKFIELDKLALQLSQALNVLHNDNIETYELIRATIFGAYSEGYTDSNAERNIPVEGFKIQSDIWKTLNK
jgi:hypothetical protein